MALGNRIRHFREKAGLTLEALSERSGVDLGTISALEIRDSSRSKYATAIARGLGMSLEDLESGNEVKLQPIPLENNKDYPAIRRVRFKLSAGASGFGVEYDETDSGAPIVFRRQWYEKNGYRPEKLFAVRVANGSMEPGLHDGDTVVVNTGSTDPKDGMVFAVNYEGEMVIKRLVRDAGSWWLHSDNPDQGRYPRKICDENCHIIGRVVHKQSERI